ncbi:MAG: NAD(P)-dependent oxidoreductase [Chloroflexi bacterium]|nr:NAD(P)-dependent oxidoreductase [Chloroflexota bacterium]
MEDRTILLTGATGYVGGLLLPALSRKFRHVKCMTRNPSSIAAALEDGVTAVYGDTTDHDSLEEAMEGVDDAFYLVHSLGDSDDFEELEAQSAKNFGAAAAKSGIKRIIFLGALSQTEKEDSSKHMASRHRTGELLRQSGVPTIEFRASVVIGAGSMPFEAVRALVERLPIMVTPRWVRGVLQPISARDLRDYLIAGLNIPAISRVIEIGGADVVRYQDLMKIYSKARGLRRMMIPVPVITPRLSSHWLRLVTPAHFSIGRRIVESAVHRSVVSSKAASELFDLKPLGTKQAIKTAISEEESSFEFLDKNGKAKDYKTLIGTRFVEKRTRPLSVDPKRAFTIACQIGGQYGWKWQSWLWTLRGWIDRSVGGVGFRKGRPENLQLGDQLDFWTVARVTTNRLTLSADMRLPGNAVFDIHVFENASGDVFLEHTVSFNPRGWIGHFYWFALYPLHALVFRKMLNNMAAQIEAASAK